MNLVILIGVVRRYGGKYVLNVRVEDHTIFLCYETYDEALYIRELYTILVNQNIIPDEVKKEYNSRVYGMATGHEANRVSED